MDLQCLGGCFGAVIAQHHAGARHADLTGGIVGQLFLGAGLEDADDAVDHRHTNVAVTHRERSHGQSGVGAGLAAAVAGSKAQVAVMLLEELLNIAQLLVVECLAAGADGQHVGHIIVSRKTLAAADNLHKHGDQGPVVGAVAHHFQVNIVHIHKRIQNEQHTAGQGQQHHGNHNSDQSRGQDGQQPSGAEFIRSAIKVHLGQHADDAVCRMDDLLGRAGGTAGVGAQQRAVNVDRSGHKAAKTLAHVTEISPHHGIRATGGNIRIQGIQGMLQVNRHSGAVAAFQSGNDNIGIHVGLLTVGFDFSLGEEVVNKNHLGIGFLNSFNVFFQGVVTAQQRSTDALGCQQQINEFRHRTQEHGDLVPLLDAKHLQSAGGGVHLTEHGSPGDIHAIVVHGNHVRVYSAHGEVLLHGAGRNLDTAQNIWIELHPGAVNAGLASQHRVLIHCNFLQMSFPYSCRELNYSNQITPNLYGAFPCCAHRCTASPNHNAIIIFGAEHSIPFLFTESTRIPWHKFPEIDSA